MFGAVENELAHRFGLATDNEQMAGGQGFGQLVEFDFALGHPELFVELVLPQDAFVKFCQHNRVVAMDEAMAKAVDDDMVKWRFGDVGRRLPKDPG